MLVQNPQDQADQSNAEAAIRRTFRLASQYIALSSALQPGKETYLASLKVSVWLALLLASYQ